MKRDKGKRPKTRAKGAIEANRLFGQLCNNGEQAAIVLRTIRSGISRQDEALQEQHRNRHRRSAYNHTQRSIDDAYRKE